MFHPATLLVLWAEFALVLPSLSLNLAGPLLLAVGVAALALARTRTYTMLRRTRWLLLSVGVLFAFATPGLSVPGPLGQLGATQDGLLLGAEHLVRLLLLLLTLALLHEHLGTAGFLSGLHWLLGLLGRAHEMRERILVRSMLVVEFVDAGKTGGSWRDRLAGSDAGPHLLMLETRRTKWVDWLAMSLATVAAGALAW